MWSKVISANGSKDAAVTGATGLIKSLFPENVRISPIRKDLFVDVDGKRIYICCGGCIEPIKKDPQMYINKLKEMGESVEVLASGK